MPVDVWEPIKTNLLRDRRSFDEEMYILLLNTNYLSVTFPETLTSLERYTIYKYSEPGFVDSKTIKFGANKVLITTFTEQYKQNIVHYFNHIVVSVDPGFVNFITDIAADMESFSFINNIDPAFMLNALINKLVQ